MNELNTEVIPYLFPTMIACHYLADYPLQGIIANLKQEKWWKENYDSDKNEANAEVALMLHGVFWSFMIVLPIMLFALLTKQYNIRLYYWMLVINSLIHSIIDDMKCNVNLISYRTDQYIHLIQIFITWVIYYLIAIL